MKFIKSILDKLFIRKDDELSATSIPQDTSTSTKIANALFIFILLIIIVLTLASDFEIINPYIANSVSIVSAIIFAIYQYIASRYILNTKMSKLVLTVSLAVALMILATINYFGYVPKISNTISVVIIVWSIYNVSR